MRRMTASIFVAVLWGGFTGAAAQLPPDVLVDKYLLQAQMLNEGRDHKGALEAMDRIVALQKEHSLTLPKDFHFHYAQTALAAGSVQAAVDSANRYLSAVGNEGKHYRTALELLVKAEQKLREPAVDQGGTNAPGADNGQQPQAVSPSQPQVGGTTEAQPVPDCGQWNTGEYFQAATVESVTTCLEGGANPKARDKDKWTPLHWAASINKNPDIIRMLLNAGALVNKRVNRGWTPLHLAAAFGENPAVVKALIDAGAKLKWTEFGPFSTGAKGIYFYMPLHMAAIFNENPDVAKTLLNAGADPNQQSFSDGTPLHMAARFNENPAVIEALLEGGAKLESKVRRSPDPWTRKKTPLHMAAWFNEHPAVIEALLRAGANVAAVDSDGRTPLSLAKEGNKNLAVQQVLLSAGAGRVEQQQQIADNRTRRKAKSGPGLFSAAVGILGGAAIASVGTEEAIEAGVDFAADVISGRSPAEVQARLDAGVNPPVGSSAGTSGGGPVGNAGSGANGGQCLIPGYPTQAGGVANLGFSWCPASVSMQVRSFALQAAVAQCAITTGSSSTPAQISSARREIHAACDMLDALTARLGGPNGGANCRCPAGLRP